MANCVASRGFITLENVLARQELLDVRLRPQKIGSSSLPGGGTHPRIQVAGLKGKMNPLRAKRAVSKCTRFCLPANLRRSAPEIAALSALNSRFLLSSSPPRCVRALRALIDNVHESTVVLS
jgi:hypothetical protein